jgi:hypothetical protein
VVESVRVDSVDRVFDWFELLGTESIKDSGVREVGSVSGDKLRDVRGDSSMRGGLMKGEVACATVESDTTGSDSVRYTSWNRFLKAQVKGTGVRNSLGALSGRNKALFPPDNTMIPS